MTSEEAKCASFFGIEAAIRIIDKNDSNTLTFTDCCFCCEHSLQGTMIYNFKYRYFCSLSCRSARHTNFKIRLKSAFFCQKKKKKCIYWQENTFICISLLCSTWFAACMRTMLCRLRKKKRMFISFFN
jgi:hypothetical protein